MPKWAKGSLIYQLFVDRFCRAKSHQENLVNGRNYREWGEEVNWQRDPATGEFTNNDFFCGDIKGITSKLDYFKLLGVEVLYLSPINYSHLRYDRYAVTDHMEIDPDVGTWDDLAELHTKANENHIHIVLDMAFNHCSSDNPLFRDAVQNQNSQYKDWFKKDQYNNFVFWYGFKDMPEFNLDCEAYQTYVYGKNGVIAKFAPFVDGFRLDLAEKLEPFFLEGIKKRANAYFPHLIVGEFWHNPEPSLIGSGIDVPTSYPLTNAILKGVAFGEFEYLRSLTQSMIEEYPIEYLNSFLVSLCTHDIVRVLTILGRCDLMRRGMIDIWKIDDPPSIWHRDGLFYTDEFRQFEYDNDKLTEEQYASAVKLLKLAMVIQYFFIGSPTTYYGTEMGMEGFKDPFNRRCMPWEKENLDKKLFSFMVALGRIRKLFNFKNATPPKVVASDSEVFCFTRKNEKQTLFVAVNRGKNERILNVIPEDFSGEAHIYAENCTNLVKILPGGFVIMIK